jgi:hypothetical protein
MLWAMIILIGLIIGMKWRESRDKLMLTTTSTSPINNSIVERFTSEDDVVKEQDTVHHQHDPSTNRPKGKPCLTLPVYPPIVPPTAGQASQFVSDAALDMARFVDDNRLEKKSRYLPANIDEYREYIHNNTSGDHPPRSLTSVLLSPGVRAGGTRHSLETRYT